MKGVNVMTLRKRSSLGHVALAGLVFVASLAVAADYTEDMVQAVNMSEKTITLAHHKPMGVSEDCKVMMNGKSATVSDVKEGDRVRVATSGNADSQKIVEIWIVESGATSTGGGSSPK